MRRTRLPRIALASAVSVGGTTVDQVGRPSFLDVDVTWAPGPCFGLEGGQGPGGAGALGDCWPSRGGTPACVKSALRRPAAALDPGSAAAPVGGTGGRFASKK